MCSVNLGQFASDAEAARAHDRAALLAAGFHAPTNYPLTEAVAAAAAATLHGSQAAAQQAQQAQQQQQAQQAQQYCGVVLRSGSWLALLEIGAGRAVLHCAAALCNAPIPPTAPTP